MVLFKNSNLPRDSDCPCRFSLNRPADATYALTNAEVKIALKLYSTAIESIFEASTAPNPYTWLDGSTRTQAEIAALKEPSTITGSFILPAASMPKSYFGSPSTPIFYTLWIDVDGLQPAIESGTAFVTETAIAV